jgi:nucleolar protein 56
MGVLGFSEDGKVVASRLFPKDASKTAAKFLDTEAGRVVDELADVVNELKKKGFTTFIFENSETGQTVRDRFGVEIEVAIPSEMGENLRRNMLEYAVQMEFANNAQELAQWVHDVSMEMSQLKVRKATEKRDLMVVQAVQALDDLDKTLNLLSARIREWYGLHFPELDRLIEKHEVYVQLVNGVGKKEEYTQENLEKLGTSKSKASQLARAAESSMGGDLQGSDMEQIQALCRYVLGLYDERANLEKYIGEVMEEVAPNTSALAGATLGARLIAIAGGLMNLAKMPASTIQVLGAEKALFRSLTTGARPPKHGVIFQHTFIHGSKRWLRGKIARVFAGRLAIAVRTDAFSGSRVGDKLKADLEKRIEELQKKYPEPRPKPSEKRPMRPRGEPRPSERRKKHGRRG